MKNFVAQVTNVWLLALVLAGCQLNDTDSAPLAPDAPFDTEESASPAQVGAVGGARNGASMSDAAVSSDASMAPIDTRAPQSTLDAAVEAGGTPDFPPLPSLEAGVLSPGNVGTPVDAGTAPNS